MVLNPMVLQPPRGCWSMSEDTGDVEAGAGVMLLVSNGWKAQGHLRDQECGPGSGWESRKH